MNTRAVLAGLVLLSACQSTPTSKAEKPVERETPFDAEKLSTRFLDACAKTCAQAQAKRAVAAQMIDAECRAGCESDWKLPLLTTSKEVEASRGDRIRIRGVLADAGDNKEQLRFADHVVLEVHRQGVL